MPDVPPDDIDTPPPKKKRPSSLPALGLGCVVALVAVLVLSAVVAVLAGPGCVRYRRAELRRAELAACRDNFRKIYAECSRAAGGSARFPEDAIAMGQYVPGRERCCAVTGRPYVYLPGRDPIMSEFVLAHERGARSHGDEGYHVLYASGRLELWPPSRWGMLEELVADQERVVAAMKESDEAGEAAMERYRKKYRTPQYYDAGMISPQGY
ncbi:MAG: hypothetical protein ACYTGB_11960 [Planctomycetota bacterium]